MPTSHTFQLNEIMELVIMSEPLSILDVGCGAGKYGVLCHERLNLWYTDNYKNRKVIIDAIEAFSAYLTPIHNYIYNQIFIAPADIAIDLTDKKYDLILLIDVLEHFEKEKGREFLRKLLQKGKNVIISTPKAPGEQGEEFGNSFERHLSGWTPEEIKEFGPCFTVPNHSSYIVFIGEKAKEIKDKIFYRQERSNGV